MFFAMNKLSLVFFKILRWENTNIIYFACKIISKLIPSLKESCERLFINMNNYCVSKYDFSSVKNILIMLPHCLQNDDCSYRITKNILNCKICGKCVICELVDLYEKTKIPVKIVSGGTFARKLVKEIRPDIIIACACENDLSSGIYDSYPFLVWGILNKRPNGPCVNTTVDVEDIKKILDKIVNNNYKFRNSKS
jgi:uncharacterized protein